MTSDDDDDDFPASKPAPKKKASTKKKAAVSKKEGGTNKRSAASSPKAPTSPKALKWGDAVALLAEEEGEDLGLDVVKHGGSRSAIRVLVPPGARETAEAAKLGQREENKVRRKRGEPPRTVDTGKLAAWIGGSDQIHDARSFADDRLRQILRWISTCLHAMHKGSIEVQCYFEDNCLYVSSNKDIVNQDIAKYQKDLLGYIQREYPKLVKKETFRIERHHDKLLTRSGQGAAPEQEPVYQAIEAGRVRVVGRAAEHGYKDGLHAERRIFEWLGEELDARYLAGVKRPCLVCLVALNLVGKVPGGPAWESAAATQGMEPDELVESLLEHVRSCEGGTDDVLSTFTRVRMRDPEERGPITKAHGSESDTDAGPPKPLKKGKKKPPK